MDFICRSEQCFLTSFFLRSDGELGINNVPRDMWETNINFIVSPLLLLIFSIDTWRRKKFGSNENAFCSRYCPRNFTLLVWQSCDNGMWFWILSIFVNMLYFSLNYQDGDRRHAIRCRPWAMPVAFPPTPPGPLSTTECTLSPGTPATQHAPPPKRERDKG